ncbi:hypothetical protein JNB_12823 [Janibacter sp. HTCC2649]|nr:hypothetical protein JNB_12823 [Janibacter sp. HTCC2649]
MNAKIALEGGAVKVRAPATVVAEGDGWSICLTGLPIAADGTTLEEALEEAALALRDYATAWGDRLCLATNQADNSSFVRFVESSDDVQLTALLRKRSPVRSVMSLVRGCPKRARRRFLLWPGR